MFVQRTELFHDSLSLLLTSVEQLGKMQGPILGLLLSFKNKKHSKKPNEFCKLIHRILYELVLKKLHFIESDNDYQKEEGIAVEVYSAEL